MTKTLVDLDDELLTKTKDRLGTATKKETVNAAMEEAVRLTAIREFLQAMGAYDRASPGLVHELATLADDPVLAALRQVTMRWLPTDDQDLAKASEIQAELTRRPVARTDVAMNGLVQPGQVLTLAEADYLYGRGDLVLRVAAVGDVERLPDGEWLPVRGVQLGRDGTELREREVRVRVAALTRRPGRS